MGVVIGIVRPRLAPALLKSGRFLRPYFGGSCAKLVMIKAGVRSADDAPAACDQPQAVVNIVVIQGQFFVESARGVEYIGAGHQTGAGDGATVSRNEKAVKITRMLSVMGIKRMERSAVQHGNAGVLNATARKEQLGADGADLRLLREFEHPFEPVGRNNLYVVIKEKEVLSFRQSRPSVHGFGPVERRLVSGMDDASLFQFQREDGGNSAAVQNDDLVGRPCTLLNALKTFKKVIGAFSSNAHTPAGAG